jgi:hypothetical protein
LPSAGCAGAWLHQINERPGVGRQGDAPAEAGVKKKQGAPLVSS